jgi:NADH pyrophosphatase NudC (nudix superfamily)
MLEKFKKTIDKSVATVSVKSNEFIEVTKLKTQNTSLEKEIDLLKKQLGAAYYNHWKTGAVDATSFEELCIDVQNKENTINGNLNKIESLQNENEQILGSQSQGDAIICSCGKSNSSTAKFCIGCGNKLIVDVEPSPDDAVEMKTCPCGNKVKITAKFCSKCGNKFEAEVENVGPRDSSDKDDE